MKGVEGQISIFDIIGTHGKVTPEWTCAFTTPVIDNGKPMFQMEDGQKVNLYDEMPICRFSRHVCDKKSLWEISDMLDDKDKCPHVCCRKCYVGMCGERCNGSKEPTKRLIPEEKSHKPGDWVESDVIGEKLTFDEITQLIGKLIVMDKSTQSHAWYKVVLVEKIIMVENNAQRRLIYYDGVKQRGLVNEMWFDESLVYPARAYKLKG